MYNLIEMQNKLKGLSKEQLMQVLKSGSVPQYMVVSELNRRKNMESDQARREATDGANTVTQEVINAVGVPQGGIAQLASAMNAKTDNTQNTGVMQMAEGGVVKAQPGGIMSNIMSLMSPPSYDVAGFSKPRVAQEPEMTALEALETIPPDAARALEISKKIQVGKSVKKVLKEAKLTGLEALNLIAGAGAYISLDTAYKSLNAIGTLFEDDDARVIFDMAQTLKDRQSDKLFKKHGNWLQRNLPRVNPNFAYTFDDREKAAEKLSLEELNVINMARQAALDEAQKPVEAGGDPSIAASLFAEGTPTEFLKGTPTTVTQPLPFGPKDTFTGFGDPAYSRFTSGFPRGTNQIGSPMTDGPAKFTMGDRSISQGDVFPSGPLAVAPKPESAVQSSVAEEISRLGIPTQTISQPPPIMPDGDSDDALFFNTSSANQPFKLGGKALEEAEARKAAQIRDLLASETTPVPLRVGPEEVSFRPSNTAVVPRIFEGDTYKPDLANQYEATLAGSMPESEDMKQQVLSEILKSYEPKGQFGRLAPIPKYDEFGDLIQPPERIQGVYPYGLSLKELQSSIAGVGIPDYGDAMADVSGRAADYFKDARAGRLDQSPEEVYGDPSLAYLPSSVRDYFAQTIENQKKAMPGGGGRSGLGALFAQTLENQQEGIPGGTDPNAKPTLQSRFDRAKLYLEGLGQDIRGMTQEDVIEFAKKAGAKGLEIIDDVAQAGSDFLTTIENNKASKAFDAEDVAVGSEPPNFREIDKATKKQLEEEQDATDTASQTEIDKLMELLNKQQSAIDKQSGASSAALSEYLSGLEKDREFDKAMALANAGAALMMPSPTFGEGLGKALKAGTDTLKKGKDSYNKNKLQVLALQGRIDAAKASAANRAAISGATVSSRILLKRREELAEQLERIAPMGTNPEGPLADRAAALREAIKQTDDQLNALITTASIGSIPTGSDIFANYDLT